ncbi:MAG: hypothetical protein WAU86_02330 [Oricola sp.]
MANESNIDDIIRTIRADIILANAGLFLIGAGRRWREERRKRNGAQRLDRSLQYYPDYLLKDIGFAASGRLRCADRLLCRF